MAKYYIRKAKKGYAYFPGDVVELPTKLATAMGEEFVRPATEVLEQAMPARDKLLGLGIETLDELNTRVKKTGVQGLGLTAREEIALLEFLTPKKKK